MHPGLLIDPASTRRAIRAARDWTRAAAVAEIIRGRLTIEGPVTAAALARGLGVSDADVDAALLALEAEGVVLRGRFSPGVPSRDDGGIRRSRRERRE